MANRASSVDKVDLCDIIFTAAFSNNNLQLQSDLFLTPMMNGPVAIVRLCFLWILLCYSIVIKFKRRKIGGFLTYYGRRGKHIELY